MMFRSIVSITASVVALMAIRSSAFFVHVQQHPHTSLIGGSVYRHQYQQNTLRGHGVTTNTIIQRRTFFQRSVSQLDTVAGANATDSSTIEDVVLLQGKALPDAAVSPARESCLAAKQTIINLLSTGKATESSATLSPYLNVMKEFYKESGADARKQQQQQQHDFEYSGDWFNVNAPEFPGNLGTNPENGRSRYTIGTLTFGNIPAASSVVCEIETMVQRTFFLKKSSSSSSTQPQDHNGSHQYPTMDEIPESIQEHVLGNMDQLRYNYIDTLFEIPDSGVQGVLRMEGYVMPNSKHPNRFDIWFVGGRCFAQPGVDTNAWEQIFGSGDDDVMSTKSDLSSSSSGLDARLSYTLPKPVHAYHDVVYLDEDFRVTIGNRGSVSIVRR